MPRTESKQQLGVRGEGLACAELERQGMQVLERNWRCRLGESEMLSEDATVGRSRACQERQLATS
jgi:putative endonuclease